MSDLRELLQDADHMRNTAQELERRARNIRNDIPEIGKLPEDRERNE